MNNNLIAGGIVTMFSIIAVTISLFMVTSGQVKNIALRWTATRRWWSRILKLN